jgi:hypothetical protein
MIEWLIGKTTLNKKMTAQISQNELSNELKEFSSKIEQNEATPRESYMYIIRAFLEIDSLFWKNIKLKHRIKELEEVNSNEITR